MANRAMSMSMCVCICGGAAVWVRSGKGSRRASGHPLFHFAVSYGTRVWVCSAPKRQEPSGGSWFEHPPPPLNTSGTGFPKITPPLPLSLRTSPPPAGPPVAPPPHPPPAALPSGPLSPPVSNL
ncbi:hypothetical protein Vretifemale_19566, partial [Volvox reticuliferus]